MQFPKLEGERSIGTRRHALRWHSLGYFVAGFGFIACDALKQQHEGDVYLNSRLGFLCVFRNIYTDVISLFVCIRFHIEVQTLINIGHTGTFSHTVAYLLVSHLAGSCRTRIFGVVVIGTQQDMFFSYVQERPEK